MPKLRDKFRSKLGLNERWAVSQPQTASSSASTPAEDVGPSTTVTTSSTRPTAFLASATAVPNAAAQPAGLQQAQTLWAKAYERVARTDPGILQPFEAGGSFDDLQCMRKIVNQRLEDRADSQLVIQLAGKSVKLREISDKVLSFVLWSKELIGAALSSDPHAQLAWTGVSLVLTLVASSQLQNESLLSGLQKISNLLPIYKIREELHKALPGGNVDLEDSIVQLYAKIVEYEARAIRHLDRSAAGRFWDDVSSKDGWAGQIKAIEQQDKACSSLFAEANVQAERRDLEAQSEQLSLQTASQECLVKALEGLRVEQRDLYFDDKKWQCLQSLSSRYRDEKDFNEPKVQGTCEWLLQDPRFRRWKESEGPNLLWISADPGCGKSVLARALIDERSVCPSIIGTTLCYFFFKEGLQGRCSRSDAWSAVLHQLFDQNQDPKLLSYALAASSKHGANLRNQSEELWDILVETARDGNAGQIIVVLDALDECDEQECEFLLDRLSALMEKSNTAGSRANLKFCITSRPEGRIERRIEARAISAETIRIQGEEHFDAIRADIEKVIKDQVPRKASQLSPTQQADVIRHLNTMSNRTYLLLKLVLQAMADNIVANPPGSDVTGLIKNLPKSVPKAYNDILKKSRYEQVIVRKLLMIIAAAQEPLSLQDVNITLAIARDEVAREKFADLKLSAAEYAKTNIKNICGLLLSDHDKVYFLHETVRDFVLGTIPGMEFSLEWQPFSERSAHELLTGICIIVLGLRDLADAANTLVAGFRVGVQKTYGEERKEGEEIGEGVREEWVVSPMNISYRELVALRYAHEDSDSLKIIGEEFNSYRKHVADSFKTLLSGLYSIVEYTSCYWPTHWRASGMQRSHESYQSTKELCDSHTSRGTVWCTTEYLTLGGRDYYGTRRDPLEVASSYGLDHIVTDFLEELEDRNGTEVEKGRFDELVGIALTRASERGHVSTAALLLVRAMEVTGRVPRDFYHAFSVVLTFNDAATSKLFLDWVPQDASLDMVEIPFSTALRQGHLDICDGLVKYMSPVEQVCWRAFRYSPYAPTARGDMEVVWSLLKEGATSILPALRGAKLEMHWLATSHELDSDSFSLYKQTFELLKEILRNSGDEVPAVLEALLDKGEWNVAEVDRILQDMQAALEDVVPGGYLYDESSSDLWIREAQRLRQICKILVEALLQRHDIALSRIKAKIGNEDWDENCLQAQLVSAITMLQHVSPRGCLFDEASSELWAREARIQTQIIELVVDVLWRGGAIGEELRQSRKMITAFSPGGREHGFFAPIDCERVVRGCKQVVEVLEDAYRRRGQSIPGTIADSSDFDDSGDDEPSTVEDVGLASARDEGTDDARS